MTKEELMIGDWVKDKYKPKPHQVDSWADFNSSEDLSPITITPEILEKNANGGWCNFDLGERSVYHIHDDKEEVSIYVEWKHIRNEPYVELDGLGWTIFKGYCASVSKLQHALRLCGLNELADNFKI